MKHILLIITFFTFLFCQAQNVGVGNTSPASKLDVSGDLALREGSALTVAAGANSLTLPSSKNSVYRLTGASGAFSISSISAGNDGMLLTLINATGQVMTITNGTIQTNTGANLVSSGTVATVNLIYNATLGKWLVASDEGFVQASSPVNIYNSNGTLTGTRTVTMSGYALDFAGGNVGINTNAPLNLLNIQASANASPGLSQTYAFGINGTSANDEITMGTDASNAYLQSWVSKPLVINGQGNNVLMPASNVGIRTTSPATALQVQQATATDGITIGSTLGGGSATNLYFNAYTQCASPEASISGIDDNGYGGHLAFSTKVYGTCSNPLVERMRITDAGNVGIGTTTPGSTLTVNGTTSTTNLQMTNGATNGYILKSDASGNASWVNPNTITTATTHTLSSSSNTITSTVNGVAATATAVNTVSNTSSSNTLTTSVNGVAATGVNIVNSNALSLSGTTVTSTINGVASNALDISSVDNNIYNTNGTLTAARTMTMGGFALNLNGGNVNTSNDMAINQVSVGTGNGSGTATTTQSTLVGSGGSATGANNTMMGYFVGNGTSGTNNTAMGTNALRNMTTGSYNAALGVSAGASQSGSYNTFLGYSAKMSGSFSNATAIGANAYVGASNSLVLGSINGVNGATASTNVGIGITSPSNPLEVVGNTKTTNLQMTSGATNGYILKSDASGNASWVAPSSVTTGTTNTLTSATNTITSTVNGVAATAPAVNTNVLSQNGTNQLVSTVNGVASSAQTLAVTGDVTGSLGASTVTKINGTSMAGLSTGILKNTTGTGVPSIAVASDFPSLSGTYVDLSSAQTAAGVKTWTGNANFNGGTLSLGNATSNLISFSNASYSPPTFTSRSVGTKILLWSQLDGSNADYAIGINLNTLWHSVPQAASQYNHAFFGGTTELMRIQGDGKVGIGTTSPNNTLTVNGSGGYWNNQQINFYTDAGSTQKGYVGLQSGQDFMLASTTNGNWMRIGANNANIAFFPDGTVAGGTPKIVISPAGYIGVGVTSPAYPLDIASTINTSYSGYGYLNNSGGTGYGSGNSGTVAVSIHSSGRILTAEVNVQSDQRIKTNLSHPETGENLDKVNSLKVTDYNYIDKLAKGNNTKRGFIAQEVETVLPNAVNKSDEVIPSVFAAAEKVKTDGTALTITTASVHGFAAGDEILLYDKDNKPYHVSVASIKDDRTFTVNDWKEKTESIFVYGKKVNDFRTIDFDQITAMAVGAIQELSKEVKDLKTKNVALENEINSLKTGKVDVSQLEQLKAEIETLKQIVGGKAQK